MKKFISLIPILGILFLLVGCIPSLHPLYTEKDLYFESKVVGSWTDNDKHQWKFEKSEEKSYLITFTEDSVSNQFEGNLIKLDNTIYMDLYPKEPPDNLNTLYKIHILPIHTFSQIKFDENILLISFMDYESFEKLIKKNKNAIKHEEVEDGYLITASTPEIQKFLKTYSNEIFTAKQQVLERKSEK